jgi:rhodanese-related sulfurtransferase
MSLDVDAFAQRVGDEDAVVINVHTPYEGHLQGTDLSIPYDQLAGDARLPESRDAEVLLYCKSGRMSRTAAEALMGEGYTNVADLEGGMDAWAAAGRVVITG